jgi:hypothetical protein
MHYDDVLAAIAAMEELFIVVSNFLLKDAFFSMIA